MPLSAAALAILSRMDRKGPLVFNSTHRGKEVSDTQLGRIMQRHAPGMKPHGLRSTFKDWSRERTTFAQDDVELCLSHVVGSATERAYARSDVLERRREIMEAYGRFASGQM